MPNLDASRISLNGAYFNVVHALHGALPPARSTHPRALRRRMDSAIAMVASLVPVNTAEAMLAANWVGTTMQAMDCQAMAHAPDLPWERKVKCLALANSAQRAAKGLLEQFRQMQALRIKREGAAPSADQAAWIEHQVGATMAAALGELRDDLAGLDQGVGQNPEDRFHETDSGASEPEPSVGEADQGTGHSNVERDFETNLREAIASGARPRRAGPRRVGRDGDGSPAGARDADGPTHDRLRADDGAGIIGRMEPSPVLSPPWHPDRLAARLPFLRRRADLTRATRAFFHGRGYLEVETPYAVPAPGEEVHLRPFATARTHPDGRDEPLWLHTSPEFAMKKLLVGGAGPIFQLARVWRNGEGSALHAPEFTMLEWYRPGAGFDDLMAETEALLRAVLPPVVTCRGVRTDLTRFERLTVHDAFARHAGADLLGTAGDVAALGRSAGVTPRAGETWEDLFFRLLLERVEPRIGHDHPTFLTHWPADQAALARLDPADPRVGLRFELFVCGIELANAFEELTDAAEQRARFQADRARRHAVYGPDWPMDEAFLDALAHGMPPASGIALGFDRLAMLAAGADRIGQVLWLPPDDLA